MTALIYIAFFALIAATVLVGARYLGEGW